MSPLILFATHCLKGKSILAGGNAPGYCGINPIVP